MFIKDTTIKNFKCFSDNTVSFCIPDGKNECSGLNIFVGENNSGKSSIMEALYFLRNKIKSDPKRIGAGEDDEYYVECNFVGDVEKAIEDFAQDNKVGIFKTHVYNSDGGPTLTVRKDFQSDHAAKKIFFWSETEGYKPIGLDASFQRIFQISNIWARTNPEDESKFGASTVCGNLLNDISKKFKLDHSEQYQQFLKIFNEVFNDEHAGLQGNLNQVAKETQQIMNEQFGPVDLKFQFDNPDPNILFKNIKLLVDDGEETELAEKGHGMQRAVILSLLQVYARRITELEDEEGNVKIKPHFLFIDEPEMGLHPQAQKKLFDALKIIAKTHQVFISTHSENFVSADLTKNITRFQKEKNGISTHTLANTDIDLKPYRKFFFHHHKLFFARKALFVEGADDYEYMLMFVRANDLDDLQKDFYMMSGSGNGHMFRQFCDALGINSYFVYDVDVLSSHKSDLHGFDEGVHNRCVVLGKRCSKKDPSNLQDANLTPNQLKEKDTIIDILKTKGVYVLRDGAVEQYLNESGEATDDAKRDELRMIFSSIKEM